MAKLTGGKSQFSSVTIRAIVVGIFALLAQFGVEFVGIDDARIDQIVEVILNIITFGSFVWAWWGRVTATEKIILPTENPPL